MTSCIVFVVSLSFVEGWTSSGAPLVINKAIFFPETPFLFSFFRYLLPAGLILPIITQVPTTTKSKSSNLGICLWSKLSAPKPSAIFWATFLVLPPLEL